jgi:chaperonin cofactor prefoldin
VREAVLEEQDLKQIEAMMRHVVGIFAEDVQHKFEILAEGQQMLSEKLEATRTELRADIAQVDNRLTVVEARLCQRIDGVESHLDGLEKKVDGLEKKVDAVGADLNAHRRDTEAHRKGWQVREE